MTLFWGVSAENAHGVVERMRLADALGSIEIRSFRLAIAQKRVKIAGALAQHDADVLGVLRVVWPEARALRLEQESVDRQLSVIAHILHQKLPFGCAQSTELAVELCRAIAHTFVLCHEFSIFIAHLMGDRSPNRRELPRPDDEAVRAELLEETAIELCSGVQYERLHRLVSGVLTQPCDAFWKLEVNDGTGVDDLFLHKELLDGVLELAAERILEDIDDLVEVAELEKHRQLVLGTLGPGLCRCRFDSFFPLGWCSVRTSGRAVF